MIEHFQSALHPAGPAATIIADLWWFLFFLCSAVFVIVMAFLAYAIFKKKKKNSTEAPLGNNRFIILSGGIIPFFVLTGMLFYSLIVTFGLRMPNSTLTIDVIGHQWWWEVHYPQYGVYDGNEIHIPAGQPVRLRLTSADVIHSFWAPNLHGKMDALPDKVNQFWIQSDQTGVFRGQCAEYCGLQHAWMAFKVVVLSEENFEHWLISRQKPAPHPTSPLQKRGKEVYFEASCHNCHAIQGTQAVGRIGPDLSSLASRQTIGSGLLPNNHANLSGWITNPQALKPGNRMPPSYLNPHDLHALMEYLETLK
jgi:cytochrome c oxidase subunit II